MKNPYILHALLIQLKPTDDFYFVIENSYVRAVKNKLLKEKK